MPATAPLTLALNDGKTIPQLGFGTCRIAPENTSHAVEQALAAGYRLGGEPAEGGCFYSFRQAPTTPRHS